jgi:hypothetical protein
MNERVKELARQANLPLIHDNFLTAAQEKFAELLVRECISTLEEKIHRSIDNEGDEIWADLILKEHFGVTE